MDNSLDNNAIMEIAKQMEGNSLALGAAVEVMTEWRDLQKAEQAAAYADVQKAQDDETQAALVKDIASQVLSELQKTLGKVDQGMPGLDGSDPTASASYDGDKHGAGRGGSTKVDDSETPVNVDKDIKTQQATIQAGGYAMKANGNGDEDDDDEDEDDMKKMDDDAKDKKSDKYPKDEDEPEDDMKKMAAALEGLSKQVADQESLIEKAVTERTAASLRKMGIVEANNLKQPELITNNALMSSDSSSGGYGSMLTKSNDAFVGGVVEEPEYAVADQLAKLSYHTMRGMEENLSAGITDGLPAEVIEGWKPRRTE